MRNAFSPNSMALSSLPRSLYLQRARPSAQITQEYQHQHPPPFLKIAHARCVRSCNHSANQNESMQASNSERVVTTPRIHVGDLLKPHSSINGRIRGAHRQTQEHDAHTPRDDTSMCHAHASTYTRTTNKQSTQTVTKKDTSHSHKAEVAVARRNVGVLFAQRLDHEAQRLFTKLDGLVELALGLVPAEGTRPARKSHKNINISTHRHSKRKAHAGKCALATTVQINTRTCTSKSERVATTPHTCGGSA